MPLTVEENDWLTAALETAVAFSVTLQVRRLPCAFETAKPFSVTLTAGITTGQAAVGTPKDNNIVLPRASVPSIVAGSSGFGASVNESARPAFVTDEPFARTSAVPVMVVPAG